jgi:hypothetical protein
MESQLKSIWIKTLKTSLSDGDTVRTSSRARAGSHPTTAVPAPAAVE